MEDTSAPERELAEDMRKTKKIIVWIVSGVMLAICAGFLITLFTIVSNNRAMYLYNPHDEVLTVTIGSDEYALKAGEKRKLRLRKDDYQVSSRLGPKAILDTTLHISAELRVKGGLINLSGESFYLWSEVYGGMVPMATMDSKGSMPAVFNPLHQAMSKNMQALLVDTTLIFGSVKEYDPKTLAIPKVWYFDIDRPMEEEITTTNPAGVSLGEVHSKIFSKQDLLEYWNANYGEKALEAER